MVDGSSYVEDKGRINTQKLNEKKKENDGWKDRLYNPEEKNGKGVDASEGFRTLK